jgi:DNA polymerase-4
LLNINTCADLQQLSLLELQNNFGKFGQQLYYYARGIDRREVQPHRIRKSVSIEHTFAEALTTMAQCMAKVPKLITDLQKRLRGYDKRIKNLFVKLKFNDFKSTTAEQTHDQLSMELFEKLIQKAWQRQEKPVRLVGLGVHLDDSEHPQQSLLF